MRTSYIYLVRHGQTVHNRDYIISGQVNPPLTLEGISQAKKVAQQLSDIEFGFVYTSDLDRAIHTAEVILGRKVPDSNKLTTLRERDFGFLDGKSEKLLDELAQSKREHFNRLSDSDQWHFKYAPDIESDYELSERFVTALKNIARLHIGHNILVVAHGGAMRTAIIKLQGLSTVELPRGALKNGAVIVLAFNGSELKVHTSR